MRLRKFTVFSGLLVFFSQFGTVGVYGLLMAIANDHNMPMEQLTKYFTIIMNTIIFVLVAFSVLFILLLLGMVWRVWTQPRGLESRGHDAADSPIPD
ncbi:MAG: hypothetical protein K0Q73_7706 [Paenibacillus sp.]|jgi:hypothetical protein|nr:hypothetical protein [Paenibacillus sp.]